MSDPVWIALIVAIPPTVVGIGQIWLGLSAKREIKADVKNLHKEVNGRMTDLIQATEKAATATGRAEGVASEQAKKP
jgi:hypothetical protein